MDRLKLSKLANRLWPPASYIALADDIQRQDTLPRSNGEHAALTARARPTTYLDGLRGLAAFLVYLSHHISWFYGPEDVIQHGFGDIGASCFATLPFVRILFTGGNAAVAIFFVLSGYVLSKPPLRMLHEGAFDKCYKSLASAILRRPLRLFIPPAGVSLAFAFIMHLPGLLAPQMTWPERKGSMFAELANWWLELCLALNPFKDHGIFEHWFPYDPPIWTIAIEFAGSMLVFILIATYSFAKPRYRLLLSILTSLWLFCSYAWSMALFIAGVVLAINDLEELDDKLLSRRLSERAKSFTYHSASVIGWFLLCQTAGTRDPERSLNTLGWHWLTLLTPNNYYDNEYWRFWNSLGAVLLVFGVLRIRWLQRRLAMPILRYLGKVSFSLYLIHIPFLWTIGDRIYRILGMIRPELQTWFDNRFPIPDMGPRGLSVRFVVAQCFILPLNLLVAQVGTVLLDEPSVELGRWLVSRLSIDKR